MKDKLLNVLSVLFAGVGLAPTGTTAGILALLGLVGGSAAVVVAGWLALILIGLSLALLARSFYVLYVLRRGSRMSTVVTWLAAAFVVSFWTWKLIGQSPNECA